MLHKKFGKVAPCGAGEQEKAKGKHKIACGHSCKSWPHTPCRVAVPAL